MFVNLCSQRKIKYSRNMSFLGTNQARLNPCEGREDPDKPTRRERIQVVAVEGGGAEVVEDMVEEGGAGAGTPMTGLSRTRTKLGGAIIIGKEATTGR